MGRILVFQTSHLDFDLISQSVLHRCRLYCLVKSRRDFWKKLWFRCSTWCLPSWLFQRWCFVYKTILKGFQWSPTENNSWKVIWWRWYRLLECCDARSMVELVWRSTRVYLELPKNFVLVYTETDYWLLGIFGRKRN